MARTNGQDVEEARQRERDHSAHQAALSRPSQSHDAPETLKFVSQPEDINSPSEALEWINSKSASTTKLSSEDVRSDEWVIQYFQLLARMERPPHYGITGHRRAAIHGDISAFKRPIEPSDKLEFEAFAELGNLNVKKSEEGWNVETSTADTKESIMRKDENKQNNGILGRFRS